MSVARGPKLPSFQAGKWPENVGIIALEVYVPHQCVNQTELEAFDKAGSGKYTVGLGQFNMGFCGDNEDINSLCMTVVHRLMERNNVAFTDVGRLEVGTETILDKSKSVKTVIMQLFASSGNSRVEGVDTTNACYGGTQALFNAVSWVESSLWDGRFALVVAADIAVYASGNARPTGGAGAVAMLVGPDAPLVIEKGLRGMHFEHAYDFYKPNLSSEFPVVDGKLSIQCYQSALDQCYQQYADLASSPDKPFTLSEGDFFAFHSPFTKLVQKSLARLKLNDFLRQTSTTVSNEKYKGLESFRGRTLESTIGDRDVEKASMDSSTVEFDTKTVPTLLMAKEVGNMYTASLYGGLASLLAVRSPSELVGKRVVLFSYGSGLASTLYSLRITTDIAELSRVAGSVADLPTRLTTRQTIPPAEFEKVMKLREETHHMAPYTPTGDPASLWPGTYYLVSVDDKHRRTYKRVPVEDTTPLCTLLPPLRRAI